jgi:uncharacterized membrane protein YphA (DoxX/SURF4 family)
MSATYSTPDNLNQSGQNLVRILIASYFVAVSLGMISGTDGSTLAQQILPEPFATFIGKAVVFTLAYLVMMGIWLRPAALLLAITTFWSSYIANFGPQGPLAIGDFWRDLALIGALFMTYAQSGPRASSRRAMFRWNPRVRQIVPGKSVAHTRVAPIGSLRAKVTPLAPRIAARKSSEAAEREIENIFAEDFDTAVAS